jgi:hypothetical protein
MTSPLAPRPGPAVPLAAKIALTLLAVAVLGYWMLWSLFLLVIRCDDTCSGDLATSGRWEYTGQFLLAAPCVAAGVIGLVLGFTRTRRPLATRLLGVSAAGGILWTLWVLGIGEF